MFDSLEVDDEVMEFSEQEPRCNYFLMITYDVLTDRRLTDFQRLLFSAITGLCNKSGYCYARNEYFEKLFDKSTDTISKSIGKLVELGYLSRTIVYKKKYDEKEDKWVQTKEIAGRRLYPVINRVISDEDNEGGIMKNHNRGYNEKSLSIINNNSIIDNLTSTKVEEEQENSSYKEENNNINNNNNYLEGNYLEEEKDNRTICSEVLEEGQKVSKTAPAAPQKKKEGLAPLIDIVEKRFSVLRYPEVNKLLIMYLKAHIGIRRLPTEEKWNKMLDDLINYSTIKISGADGGKFLSKVAIQVIEKALNGKDGAPFTEFDNPNIEKEPQFNLNQEFKRY